MKKIIKTFLKFVGATSKTIMVTSRNPEEILFLLPDECEFYFYDSLVNDNGKATGQEINVSKHYFKASEHYVDPDYFRVYIMRCYSWPEHKIWDKTQKSYKFSNFTNYTLDKYPNGVIIVNNIITNPRNGIIISAKKEITEYIMPTEEDIKIYA